MSVLTIDFVLRDRSLTGEHRLLFLALADGGGSASIETICRWANCDEEHARDLMDLFLSIGLFEYEEDCFGTVDYQRVVSPWLIGEAEAHNSQNQKPKQDNRKNISRRVREFVFKRDGHVCSYCGDEEGPFHLDHINPVSRGGSNKPDNLTVACVPCNLSKGAKTPDEWRPQ